MNYVFTKSERTVRKYTVAQALASAERRLKNAGVKGTCINAISRRSLSDKITLEELNEISDAIYSDSVYHA